ALLQGGGDGGLEPAAADFRVAMANLRAITDRLRAGDGTLGALLEDPTVYENLVQFLEGARRSFLLRSLMRSTIDAGAGAVAAARRRPGRRDPGDGGALVARERTVYRCQECGLAAPKAGTCPDCARSGNFVQLVEERPTPARGGLRVAGVGANRPLPFGEISVEGGERVATGIGELGRGLGGGGVKGSLVLIGGDPGIGKSTLLLQASRALAEGGGPVLYVSGEESAGQVKLRAERLGIAPGGLYFVAENDLQAVEAHVTALKPRVLVVDSI